MPILVKLLRFGAERDPVELARRAQLLELSVADIARTAAGGEFPGIPHMNSAHVVQAVTEMDAIILKALLGRMEGLKPAAAPALPQSRAPSGARRPRQTRRGPLGRVGRAG